MRRHRNRFYCGCLMRESAENPLRAAFVLRVYEQQNRIQIIANSCSMHVRST